MTDLTTAPKAVPRVRVARYAAREWGAAHLRRLWKQRELHPVHIAPTLGDAHLIAVLVVKDEATRFPYLLEYYRRAGVDHFIVIDNGSTDGLSATLASEPDISMYAAHGGFAAARYGIDWVNTIAARHCAGRWILHVDADELLVIPGYESLQAACADLDSRHQRAVHALMLDMYSDQPASRNDVPAGTDPLAVCALYDAGGYEHFFDPLSLTTWIKGGVRGRLFFPDIHAGPALNKTPLVKWKRGYAFAQVAHRLVPRALNRQSEAPQAALLHFTFTSLSHAKFSDRANLEQHTAEYNAYSRVDETSFVGLPTRTYGAPHDLVAEGIIRPLR